MDGFSGKTLLVLIIWGYPYFWKHPYSKYSIDFRKWFVIKWRRSTLFCFFSRSWCDWNTCFREKPVSGPRHVISGSRRKELPKKVTWHILLMAEFLHQLRLVVYPIICIYLQGFIHRRWCRISSMLQSHEVILGRLHGRGDVVENHQMGHKVFYHQISPDLIQNCQVVFLQNC